MSLRLVVLNFKLNRVLRFYPRSYFTGAYASKRQCDIRAFFVQKLNIFHYAFINYTISVNVSDQGVFQIRFCRCFSQPLICNLSIWGI